MSREAQDRWKTLAASLRHVAKHPRDEEAIHKLRVAIRRFTQTLRVFQDSFEPAHLKKIRRRLKKLMDLCGAARNCDIALQVLEAAGVPADKALRRRLHLLRSRAERKLVKRLSGEATRADLRHWSTWLRPKARSGEAVVDPRAALAKLARDVSKAGVAAARAEASFAELHAFRLLVKRYRYTLEILSGPKRRLEILRRVQDRLGAINDCVTAGELIADCGVEGADLRRITTALNRLLERRTVEFRIYWRKNRT